MSPNILTDRFTNKQIYPLFKATAPFMRNYELKIQNDKQTGIHTYVPGTGRSII